MTILRTKGILTAPRTPFLSNFQVAQSVPRYMMSRPINRLLVANRGEIAVRVIRSCREAGIHTIAIYSEPDRLAPHVRLADEAYLVGPAPASESYLNQATILDVAQRSRADALHPGYGFLSENAEFAEACASAGITFVGPPPEAIRAMGDKPTARALMAEAGVPMAPGTMEAVQDAGAAMTQAERVGYPVLLKAAAGGGGKGMRLVQSSEEMAGAFETAAREAAGAFGDGRLYVEKYLLQPRHIEFQILADTHANVVHLFERECSIQRRHQKVIEEAPSPIVDDSLRAKMGEAAVAAARSCGYVGAGTVEFLVDEDRRFYFMEMNTRIQVEHGITELITGVDLVREQIRIAQGQPLRHRQEDLSHRGHAIECRVYAEDPSANFLPDPGRLTRHLPPMGPGIRVDAGVDEGGEVLVHYDPMIAKLMVWGEDRDHAIERMKGALDEYEIGGVRTTIPFCQWAISSEAFVHGDVNTRFIETHFKPESLDSQTDESSRLAALAAALFAHSQSNGSVRTSSAGANNNGEWSRWIGRRRLSGD